MLIEIEKPCLMCYGTGQMPRWNVETFVNIVQTCDVCEGKGCTKSLEQRDTQTLADYLIEMAEDNEFERIVKKIPPSGLSSVVRKVIDNMKHEENC